MATLSLKVKNAKLDQTLDYLLQHFGRFPYQATIPDPASTVQNPLPDIANPLTKQETVEGLIETNFINFIYQNNKRIEALKAAELALDTTTIIG